MDAERVKLIAAARAKARASAAAMTDEEDAELTAAANADPDNPIRDEEWFARAKPMSDERLGEYRNMRGRGPQKSPTKTATSIRLDADVVEHFKAGGPGWQSRINEALRKMAGL